MPAKIKANDLSYDSNLPPFLQRLHDQKAGRGDTDLHERQFARPKRAKDADEDDDPTVVDESGETLSKEEFAKLTAPESEDVAGDVGGSIVGEIKEPKAGVEMCGALPVEGERKSGEVKVVAGLSGKKRKAAKVVGDDDAEETTQAKEAATTKNTSTKSRKKVKPVKLAFDDADDG
ncbi:hypothetical protein LTR62_000252 [Meristemomyces frigidus]|uniref:DUF4604 domain-containing protein n=1 Tax=Meristemomyces frigidus TaxID=1508187 RepID=A0AAN7TRD5_9PEZI|nr:hypothetical protein LTR62_000252 [Meristemomyces frigidus]